MRFESNGRFLIVHFEILLFDRKEFAYVSTISNMNTTNRLTHFTGEVIAINQPSKRYKL